MKQLFSARGRAARKTFWLTNLGITAVYAVACGIIAAVLMATVQTGDNGTITHFGPPAIAATAVGVLIQPFFIWTLLAVAIKRCHDHGRSGVFLFLSFVPLANTWLLVEQAFVPGTVGPNPYGPDPVTRWMPPLVSAT
jgi:uncharacterized membrane protein YhaH (DUF805 family)